MLADQESSARLRSALSAAASSARLQAALTAGTAPNPAFIEALIERCAIEPDFYVRDMLTWALTRHPPDVVIERLLPQLRSGVPQARSQALHTLSKLGEPRVWPAITSRLLQDANDEVARAAWRAAAGLVPRGEEAGLATVLATQFGRGEREVQLSLSRAFAVLGDLAAPEVARATSRGDAGARAHAIATERLMADPDEGFDAAVADARRIVASQDALLPPD